THNLWGVPLRDVFAVEFEAPRGDLAIVAVKQARNCPQQRGLAGAIAAEQSDNAALSDMQAHPTQYEHDVVVHDLDVLHGQHLLLYSSVGVNVSAGTDHKK